MRAWPWVAVVLIALGVRFVFIWQVSVLPFFDTPVGDAASYDAWAQRIASGDWWGDEAFYQAPAYPYFLAIVYRLIGHDLWGLRFVQACMGALSCVFVVLAGRAFFSRRIGFAAGLILALYPPAIFFDGLIQKTSLGLLLMSAILWRAGAMQKRPVWWGSLALGVLLGLFGLTRENALVLVVVVLLWLWAWFRDRGWTVRLGWTAALAGGLLLTLGSVAYRNYCVGGELAITTVQAGPNFYIGNNPTATGRYTPLVSGHESPPFERQDATHLAQAAVGRTLTAREVSHYWLGRSWDFIRHHPTRWAALVLKKFLLVINAYEITDVQGYYLYRDFSPLLGAAGTLLHFGILCPLAVGGVVLSWTDRQRFWVLLAFAISLAAGVAAFYVFARYRFPLVPVFILFAAAGLIEAHRRVRAREFRSLVGAAIAVAMTAAVCNVRINPERQLDAMAYANLGTVLAQQGRLDPAIDFLTMARDGNPDSPEVHFNLGRVYCLRRRYHEAVESFLIAKRLDPTLIEIDYHLGITYEAINDIPRALRHYHQAVQIDPHDADAHRAIQRLERE